MGKYDGKMTVEQAEGIQGDGGVPRGEESLSPMEVSQIFSSHFPTLSISRW